LKELLALIERLKHQIETYEDALSDASLFQSNPERFNTLTDELNHAQTQLLEAEEEWLELEMLREEAEDA
jgi:ATP-binding cassette subfamily F protein uup